MASETRCRVARRASRCFCGSSASARSSSSSHAPCASSWPRLLPARPRLRADGDPGKGALRIDRWRGAHCGLHNSCALALSPRPAPGRGPIAASELRDLGNSHESRPTVTDPRHGHSAMTGTCHGRAPGCHSLPVHLLPRLGLKVITFKLGFLKKLQLPNL